MTKDEALKLAHEALKKFHYAMIDAGVLDRQEVLSEGFTAATAIKEALAQPKQEPVAWMCKRDDGHFDVLTDHTCKKCFPVYTTPPQRTWQGLTHEEIDYIYTGIRAVHHDVDSDVLCRAIEAKLKEKNT